MNLGKVKLGRVKLGTGNGSGTNQDPGAAPAFPWASTWPEIKDERVRAAFAAVHREEFVREELRPYAVQDEPLPIAEGQTTSQPFVVAWMLQAAAIRPGDRVLEIGVGSGFATALLCQLAVQPGQPLGATVHAVERFDGLLAQAHATLQRLGYAPHLHTGDGAAGRPEAAPFDGIIVSAAAAHVPLPLWQQLAEGGRLILPIGAAAGDQELHLLRKHNGAVEHQRLGGVRFVPLISPLLDDPTQWLPI